MPVYRGRREGTHRVTVYSRGRQYEEIVQGTRAQALELEAEMRLRLRARSRSSGRDDPPLCELLSKRYAAWAAVHLGARTWRTARQYQIAALATYFGQTRLSALRTEDVDGFTAMRRQMVSAVSVNNELRTLSSVLTWAREDRALFVPEVKIRKLREAKRRVRTWTADEVDRLLVTCRKLDRALLPILVFLLNTGCRKGEALAAVWSWVNEQRRMLCIGPSDAWMPKDGEPREIPISDSLWSTLRALPRGTACLFPNRSGEPFTRFPDMRFIIVRRAAGVKGGPHTCRHTFASHFLAAGRTIQELAAILGHSILRTTERYAHLLPGHMETARNAVDFAPGGTLARRARRAR